MKEDSPAHILKLKKHSSGRNRTQARLHCPSSASTPPPNCLLITHFFGWKLLEFSVKQEAQIWPRTPSFQSWLYSCCESWAPRGQCWKPQPPGRLWMGMPILYAMSPPCAGPAQQVLAMGTGHPLPRAAPMKGPRSRWHHGPKAQPGAAGRSGRPGRAQEEAGHRERGCCPCPPLGRRPASAHREACTAGHLAHPPPAPNRPLTHDFNFRKDDQSPPSRGSAQSSAKCPRETCGDRHSEPGAGTMRDRSYLPLKTKGTNRTL